MNNPIQPRRVFDLQERTYRFAKNTRALLKMLPPDTSLGDDKRQLMRSSGSVAANYLEANEALGMKDFPMRMKIARKEAKESSLWLRLLKDQVHEDLAPKFNLLIQEATELVKIFSSIILKFRH